MNKVDKNNIYMENIFIISMMSMLFTQFRLFSLPIGIGEIGLLGLGLIILIKVIKEKINLTFLFKNPFVIFWLLTFLLLAISYLWVNIMDIHHSDTNVIHDILAYGFVLYCIGLFLMLEKFFNISINIIMERMLYYSILFYGVLLAFTFLFGTAVGITGHYFAVERYMGLSSNPNQLALLFTIIPFMIFAYSKGCKTKLYNNDINAYLSLLSIIIIWYISSRGLVIGVVLGILLIVPYYFNKQIKKMMLFLYLILIILILYNYSSIIDMLFSRGMGGLTHRIELWGNGIELIKLSPFIGFGPGAHVSTIVDMSHYWEVHNTFLDLLLQTGMVGLIAYLILLYKISSNLIRNGNIFLIAAFVALIVFSSVHFVLRHPIFWFYLFYFYQVRNNKKCVE